MINNYVNIYIGYEERYFHSKWLAFVQLLLGKLGVLEKIP